MNPPPASNPSKRHRVPAEIISHYVWLYFRFCLSNRDVEEPMAERGSTLTYEAVRYRCRKFGQAYANQLRRRRPRPGDKWHLKEVIRVCKDQLALTGCQARSERAQLHHVACCLVAFCVLERERYDRGVNIYKLKRRLSFKGPTLVLPALEQLKSAA